MSVRDEFSESDKRKLAQRAGYQCSFPGCKISTVGPSANEGVTLIGEACHIHAARPGGPRYNLKQTPEQRKSLSNGIWLCANHHTVIDRDFIKYDPAKLLRWKEDAETHAKERLENPSSDSGTVIHSVQGLVQGSHNNITNHFYAPIATPQKLEAKSFWYLPHMRNPDFVGRELDLYELGQALARTRLSAITPMAAATGLGGIGKTQLAIEFAYRQRQHYPGGVFWLNCGQAEQLPDEIAHCGLVMKLFAVNDPVPVEQKLHLVQSAWQDDCRLRLLVFDNCEEETVLQTWAPQGEHHHVLVTSRRQHWSLPGLESHTLDSLNRNESVALLQAQVKNLSETDAEAIATELGDLPLALFLAARYLHNCRHQISPQVYLDALRQTALEHPSLKGRAVGSYQPTAHDTHVGRCFALSFERLDSEVAVDRLALEILLRASYFAPGEAIHPGLLLASLAGEFSDETPSEALLLLVELGLLRPEDNDQLSLHRLLGYYSQACYDDEICRRVEETVVLILVTHANHANLSGLPVQMSPFIAHLRHQFERSCGNDNPACYSLCANIGYYLMNTASYAEAEQYFRHGLASAESIHGAEKPETSLSLHNLGHLFRITNRLSEAEPLMRRALSIDEATFGSDHSQVAIRLSNLGGLLMDTDRMSEAEPLIRRALSIDEAKYGSEHPNLARGLNNLAVLLMSTNRVTAAEPLILRALSIDEASLGSEHPHVARGLINLALVLKDTARQTEAELLTRRALEIDEATFGSDHPNVAIDLNQLALLLIDSNRSAEAEPLMRRALDINEAKFGRDHPNVGNDLNNLIELLQDINRPSEAEQFMRRSLAIIEAKFGSNDWRVVSDLNRLALLLKSTSRLSEAEPLLRRALSINESSFGSDHLVVAKDLYDLAFLLVEMKRLDLALPMWQRALKILTLRVGANHPRTVIVRKLLKAYS